MPLSREEHGEERAGRITSTLASLLLSGSKRAWTSLAYKLDNPDPFHEATFGPMAEGVMREPELARRFLMKHPEIELMEDPKIIRHHDPGHPYHDLVASSPDRMADGIPVECKWVIKRARWQKLSRPISGGFVPSEFRDQVEWHAWISGTGQCWIVVGTDDRYVDKLLYLHHAMNKIDVLLEAFMDQYTRYKIVGFQP